MRCQPKTRTLHNCRVVSLAILTALLVGCPAGPDKPPLAKRLFAVDNATAAEDQNEVLPQALRRKRKRWGPAPFYVDGKFLAMLRYPELHPALPTLWERQERPDRDRVDYIRRFAWQDLFEAHGVSIEKIKAVHFYGGRHRISICEGDEFRRVGKTYRFSYNDGEGGKLRQRPPKGGVKVNSGVDIVQAVVVYVDRDPPTSYKAGKMMFSDGKVLPVRDERRKLVIPYESGELHGGTRVYVDGVYVDAFRRRALGSELLLDPASKSSPYSLAKSLKSMKIDVSKVKRIQLNAIGDKTIADWQESELAMLDQKTFRLSQHSRGRVQMAGFEDKILASLMIYVELEPAKRQRVTSDGSHRPHGDREKANDSVDP